MSALLPETALSYESSTTYGVPNTTTDAPVLESFTARPVVNGPFSSPSSAFDVVIFFQSFFKTALSDVESSFVYVTSSVSSG